MVQPDIPAPRVKRPSRDTLQDRIYESLLDAIMSGDVVPGTTLSIRSLAQAMGTSAIPVREAVRRLVTVHALEVLPNGSVAVALLSREQFRDLCWVRCHIEGLATEAGTKNLSRRKLAALERVCVQMEKAFAGGDRKQYLAKNKQFRFTIYEAASSPALLSIVEGLWLQIGPILNVVFTPEASGFGLRYHRDALDAMVKGDATGARRAIVQDITETGEYILTSSSYFTSAQRASAARG